MTKDPRLQRLKELIERQVAAHFDGDLDVEEIAWPITKHLNNTIEAAWPAIMEDDARCDACTKHDIDPIEYDLAGCYDD